jgi:hypothetical protein
MNPFFCTDTKALYGFWPPCVFATINFLPGGGVSPTPNLKDQGLYFV